MPPPPPTAAAPTQSRAFRQSLAPTSAYARHLSHAAAQATLYANQPAPAPTQRTERDILVSHHRFLAPPAGTAASASYETALVAAYDSKLYKEFVLVSLSRWREGLVAMRWRTEDEVMARKGTDACAELECDSEATDEQEVLFAYQEEGERKEALVKARLCGRCRDRLGRAMEREKRSAAKREDRSRSRSRSRLRRTKDGARRRRRNSSADSHEAREHRRQGKQGRSRSPLPDHGDDERRHRRKSRSKSRRRHRSEA